MIRAELIASSDVLRFDASDLMPPEVGVGTFWTGIVEYVSSRDLDRTVAAIDAGFETGAAGEPDGS